MVFNFSRISLFSAIIFLIGFQYVAFAGQNINLNLSPSEAYVGETTTFTIELTSTQNLSNVVIHFYVDSEKKGAKYLFKIEKNKKNFITFDCNLNKDSYFGEHYIELKTDFITENQEKGSENFYDIINVNQKRQFAVFEKYFLYALLSFFLIGLIFISYHSKHYPGTNVIEFDHGERKNILSIIVTVLPISISIFTLYFTQRPELKIGMLSILLNFTTSIILALYSFIIAEKKSEILANNVTIYSLCFLILGLLEMLLMVFIF